MEDVILNPRKAFATYPSGVAVVTVFDHVSNRNRAITISSFSSLSLNPVLCMYALERSAKRFNVISSADSFVINVLSEDQVNLALSFAKSDDLDVWSQFAYSCNTRNKNPIMGGIKTFFDCDKYHQYDGGDHVIIVGEVKECKVDHDLKSLLYLDGSFKSYK